MSTESRQPAKLHASVEDRFRRVAMEPDRERKFPVGPESAKRLGYGGGEVDALPSSLTESFRGANNPTHRARTTGRPVRAVLRYARPRAQPRSAHLVRQSWVAESNTSTTANSTMHKSLKRQRKSNSRVTPCLRRLRRPLLTLQACCEPLRQTPDFWLVVGSFLGLGGPHQPGGRIGPRICAGFLK